MQRPASQALSWLPILLTALPVLAGPAPAPPTPPIALAAAATWTAVGPNGGDVTSLATAAGSRTLYAGTSGGVYVSTDAGATWTLEARQIGQQPIVALAVDPLHAATVYAGTATEGIWKSTDGAASWAPASGGLPGLAISALAIDPTHPTVLYASLAAIFPSGPYKSTNGGHTWTRANAGLPSEVIVSLAVDPANSSIVYVATRQHGVFQSRDGGATWGALSAPFPGARRVAAVKSPGGTLVFAVSLGGVPPQGIFRSADGGATWVDVLPISISIGIDLPLAFGPGGLLYIQGAKSADFGDHWTVTGIPGFTETALLVDPAQPTTVYAASGHGLYKTADGATTWAGASRGLHATAVASVAVNPRSGGVLAGVDGSGLLRLRQGARSEDPTAWRPVLAENAGFMVFDPSRPSTVYAGLNGGDRDGDNQIAKSVDGGLTWNELSLFSSCLELADVAVDPTDSNVLYAGGTARVASACTHPPALTYKSTDGGETWKTMTLASALRFAVDPDDPRIVYALGRSPQLGVYKSTDRGATWHSASLGLTGDLFDLALDASAPERLYVSGAAGIFASLDGARSWQRVSSALKDATVLRVDPAVPLRLYAAVPGVGAFVSKNGGKGWSALDDGHLPALVASTLEIDPTTPGRLYVGTEGAGLFRVDVAP